MIDRSQFLEIPSKFFVVVGGKQGLQDKLFLTKEEAIVAARECLQRNPVGKYYILESVATVKCDFPVVIEESK